jgi:hypothetical protein
MALAPTSTSAQQTVVTAKTQLQVAAALTKIPTAAQKTAFTNAANALDQVTLKLEVEKACAMG